MPRTSPVYKASSQKGVLRQGEIISGLTYLMLDLETAGRRKEKAEAVMYPLVIVVTQDCDLEQDFVSRDTNERLHRRLPYIHFCEVETAQEVRHASRNPNAAPVKQARSTTIQNDKMWNAIIENQDFRYHYLRDVPAPNDRLGSGLEPMVIEFKRSFSVLADEVYLRIRQRRARRRCVLKTPYLEHFNTRYHYYHYRVALPVDHHRPLP